jgi:hypothetical protein
VRNGGRQTLIPTSTDKISPVVKTAVYRKVKRRMGDFLWRCMQTRGNGVAKELGGIVA